MNRPTSRLSLNHFFSTLVLCWSLLFVQPALAELTVTAMPQIGTNLTYPHTSYADASTETIFKAYVEGAADYTVSWDVTGNGVWDYTGTAATSNCEYKHTYPLLSATRKYNARVKVEKDGIVKYAAYPVMVYAGDDITEYVKTQKLIDDAIWSAHKNIVWGTIGTNRIASFSGGYIDCSVSLGIQIFQNQGHTANGDAANNPYVKDVVGMHNYLINFLRKQLFPNPMTGVPAGYTPEANPDSNANGFGFGTNSLFYQDALVLLGLASSGLADRVVPDGFGADKSGRTYGDLVQDMVDWVAYGQLDDAASRGSWRYQANNNSGLNFDGSVQHFVTTALLVTKNQMPTVTIPDFVKAEVRDYCIPLSTNAEMGFRYSDALHPEPNMYLTSGNLSTLLYADYGRDSEEVQKTCKYIADHWMVPGTDTYVPWATMKGARAFSPWIDTFTTTDGSTTYNWYEIYRTHILNNAGAQGAWDVYFPTMNIHGGNYQPLVTFMNIEVLQDVFLEMPPMPVGDANTRCVPPNFTVKLNHRKSFHMDSSRSLILFEWDFNGDGIYDYATNNALEQVDFMVGGLGTYTPVLRVMDDNGKTAVYRNLHIEATDGNHPPIINLIRNEELGLEVDYVYDIGYGEITFNAAATTDPDTPADAANFTYEWDINGDDVYDDATGATVTLTNADKPAGWEVGGLYTVAVKVTDNGFAPTDPVQRFAIASATVKLVNDSTPVATDQTVEASNDSTQVKIVLTADAYRRQLTGIITTLPTKGTLYTTTDGITLGEEVVLDTDLSSGATLIYTYPSDAPVGDVVYDSFTFKIKDILHTSSNEATVSIKVKDKNDAPIATSQTITIPANTVYTGTLGVSDADVADTHTFSFNSTPTIGKLTLTDVNTGDFAYSTQQGFNGTVMVVYKVTDAGGLESDPATLTLRIGKAIPPAFSSVPVSTGNVESVYTYTITASDGEAADTLTITAPTKPDWLTLTDNGNRTAVLTGTPGDTGSFGVTLSVTDGGYTVRQAFTITVGEKIITPPSTGGGGTVTPTPEPEPEPEPTPEPPTEVNDETTVENKDTSVTISWPHLMETYPGVILIRTESTENAPLPQDGVVYTEGQPLGGGTVIYAGEGSTYTDTAIESGKVYTYYIIPYTSKQTYGTPIRVQGSVSGTDSTNLPPVIRNLHGAPVNQPAPMRVTFTCDAYDPDGEVARYLWTFGDGSAPLETSEGSTVTHIYAEAGVFQVSLIVTDNEGATTFGAMNVPVLPADGDSGSTDTAQVPATLTASVTEANAPVSVVLSAAIEPTPENPILRYLWDFDNDGIVDLVTTTPTTSFTFGHVGDYNVRVTACFADNTQQSATTQVAITGVNGTPPAVQAATPSTTSGEAPLPTTFTVSPEAGSDVVAYRWDLDGDGVTDLETDTGSLEHIFDTPGQHVVTVTLVGANGLESKVTFPLISVAEPVLCTARLLFPWDGSTVSGNIPVVCKAIGRNPGDTFLLQTSIGDSETWATIATFAQFYDTLSEMVISLDDVETDSSIRLRVLIRTATGAESTSNVLNLSMNPTLATIHGFVENQGSEGSTSDNGENGDTGQTVSANPIHQGRADDLRVRTQTPDDNNKDLVIYHPVRGVVNFPRQSILGHGYIMIRDLLPSLHGAGSVEPNTAARRSTQPDTSTLENIVSGMIVEGDGLQLQKPARFTLLYTDADNDGIVDGTSIPESALRVFHYNEDASRWDELYSTSIEALGNRVTFNSDLFGAYAVATEAPTVSPSLESWGGTVTIGIDRANGTYAPGDIQKATFDINAYGNMDVYLAVAIPEDAIFCLDPTNTFILMGEPVAIVSSWTGEAVAGNFYDGPLPEEMPEGTYAWVLVLCKAGTAPLDTNNWVAYDQVNWIVTIPEPEIFEDTKQRR